MFSLDQLREAFHQEQPIIDLSVLREAQAMYRLRQETVVDPSAGARLASLVEAVLVSAPGWGRGEGAEIVISAAEVAETLALLQQPSGDGSHWRLRAALLYELADLPMMAAAMVGDEDGPSFLIDFFKRRKAFRSLGEEIVLNGHPTEPVFGDLLKTAACQEALALIEFQHEVDDLLQVNRGGLEAAARHLSLDLSLTEVKAFFAVLARRASRATRSHTPSRLMKDLRTIGFPPELWEAQSRALDGGLLDPKFDAWGLAAPTGTGKTFLARLIILDALRRQPAAKVLYLVPSKALVYQVARDLGRSLEAIEIVVSTVTPQLAALNAEEDETLRGSDVLVLTPEKADLLLRIGAEFLRSVSLVIVDEAHHIEDGTRGVLLELYLARLGVALAEGARLIFLSAVAPNISDITDWVGITPGGEIVEERGTRMKVGVYGIRRRGRNNHGVIEYTNGTSVTLFNRGVKKGKRAGIVQLAHRLGVAGPVLVVAQGQRTSERIAADLRDLIIGTNEAVGLTQAQVESAFFQRLDARLEREMYKDVGLRDLIRYGVAYHHAGLPPRVREALEDAITAGLISFVVATTTLAEGVNFPFSTVVVQSLSIPAPTFETGKPLSHRVFTPRKFWNIAGRAGRPGYDHEGQVILYEPSLGLEKVNATIEPYIRPNLRDIPPVTSALAEGLASLRKSVNEGLVSLADLDEAELGEHVAKSTRGIVNLLRVGLAHAKASGIELDAAEYFDSTFAARLLPESESAFARRLLRQQKIVLETYLAHPNAPSIRLVAELGLSIDTLSRLQGYVQELGNWQLEALTHVLRGGRINMEQLPYVLGNVLSRMAELEGGRLSGWYSRVVVDWCAGMPFSTIKRPDNVDSLEDLIRLVYSRIQYILPWGLYATDRFVAEETRRRGMSYAGEVNLLAYLVDAGVPDWAALRLTSLGFERTDAARLSQAYFRSRESKESVDVVGWLLSQTVERLSMIVEGRERRRLDYDFVRTFKDLRGDERINQ